MRERISKRERGINFVKFGYLDLVNMKWIRICICMVGTSIIWRENTCPDESFFHGCGFGQSQICTPPNPNAEQCEDITSSDCISRH